MKTMEIRDYKQTDLRALLRIFHEAVHVSCAKDYSPEQRAAWAPETLNEAAWAKRFAESQTRVAVNAQDEVLGFANLEGSHYLDCLYVSPKAQGQGVGSALCAAMEALAVGDIEIRVSLTARPFFERRGYRVLREVHPIRAGIALPAFEMRLTR